MCRLRLGLGGHYLTAAHPRLYKERDLFIRQTENPRIGNASHNECPTCEFEKKRPRIQRLAGERIFTIQRGYGREQRSSRRKVRLRTLLRWPREWPMEEIVADCLARPRQTDTLLWLM
jgi:hypothetical protein